MKLSSVQEKFFAWDISHKKSVGDDSKFTGVLSEARVDLNPHQVDAALFAFNSPLSKGAILADEVGLGKTIEAGIILSQFWAEHRRRILVILPASLRSQWNIELMEKFYLPSSILVTSEYKTYKDAGRNPFEQDAVILCSYHFAAKHSDEIHETKWDLVVLDEAHKMRNVFKKKNKISNLIKASILPYKKVLLTATPLQNNLNELYGLVSIVDQNYFANIDNFSEEYNAVTTRDTARYGALKERLQGIVQRTLRRQVQEYVKYTKRTSMVEDFVLSEDEQKLYDGVTEYLSQPFLYGVPDTVKALMTIIIRKIMASSSYALSFTLGGMISRLEEYKAIGSMPDAMDSILREEEDVKAIYEEEEKDGNGESDIPTSDATDLDEEIEQLKSLRDMAASIEEESKVVKLLSALDIGFKKLEAVGANRKALVFTESCRTQSYLKEYLENNGYKGNVVCFNGTNDSPASKAIYSAWIGRYQGTDRVSGELNIDRKQALVDYFKDAAEIMIATEAGAEGINLQFCSMVVNYDMPWNPQRIEQRIGRCHRYGQKHDVVVVNFVNQENAADKRVYELLNTKFNLFDGVFGSSDEILGALDSGIDFEKKLCLIYQTCRTESEINAAFDKLQQELEDIISERMNNTRRTLLEHFDEEVIKKLKSRQEKDIFRIDQFSQHMWRLACSILRNKIYDIDEKTFSFSLADGIPDVQPGRYSILRGEEALHIRSGNEIGKHIIDTALNRDVSPSEIIFDLSGYKYHSATLEKFKGQSGYCIGYRVRAESQKDQEESLLICGISDDGKFVPDDFGRKLLELNALSEQEVTISNACQEEISSIFQTELAHFEEELAARAKEYLNVEIDKLYAWADDNLYPLEEEVGQIRKRLEANRRLAKKASSATERFELKKEESELRKVLVKKMAQCEEKREYYDKESERQIDEMGQALNSKVSSSPFFIIRWGLK